MVSSHNESVIRVKSNKNDKEFGTGFVVYTDKNALYIVTCDHVLTKIFEDDKNADIQIGNQIAEIIVRGESNGLDLAVLKISLQKNIAETSLRMINQSGKSISIVGYRDAYYKECIETEGVIIDSSYFESERYGMIKVWNLEITGKCDIENGMSGSPIIDKDTHTVLGVLIVKEKERRGKAISIEALSKVWSDSTIVLFIQNEESEQRLIQDRRIGQLRHEKAKRLIIQVQRLEVTRSGDYDRTEVAKLRQRAIKLLKEAVELQFVEPEIFLLLGQLHEEMENKLEAFDYYSVSIRLKGNFEDAFKARKNLCDILSSHSNPYSQVAEYTRKKDEKRLEELRHERLKKLIEE
ncbi:MAG: serine protease [Chloroflexales bacterium]|nr:serine protease [Chloroflexales bacterium]